MIETAVILAAGRGSRLKEITDDRPKGFIVLNKIPIIEESIQKLYKVGIKRIFIGTGYHSEQYDELAKKYPAVTCIKNDLYSSSGSMYTLFLMRDWVRDDFLLLESDLIYERCALENVLASQWADTVLTSGRTGSGDEAFVEVDQDYLLVNVSKDPTALTTIYSELVGISKISGPTYRKLCRFAEKEFLKNTMLDYEYALVGIAKETEIHVQKIDDLIWSEIDDKDQLNRAKNIVYPKLLKREKDEKN
jgi:2-aminoethylphosphonate-pyruvate transaminase